MPGRGAVGGTRGGIGSQASIIFGKGIDALIVADGFSCREQIEQTTPRRTLHLAEVLELALAQQSRTTADYAAVGTRS